MFLNPGSLQNALKQNISFWVGRSTTWRGHFKSFDYFPGIFTRYEQAALILSLLALPALNTRFSRWCAWWTATSIAIYSAIPYKTPWLDINMILPMALLAGCGASYYIEKLCAWKKTAYIAIAFALLAYSAWAAWETAYIQYANPSSPLVYVASTDAYTHMVSDIMENAERMSGKQTHILVKASGYWPLPWSLRDYKLLYGGGQTSEPIVISDRKDYSDILPQARNTYNPPVRYEIRHGTYVYVYYRRDGVE